MATVLGDKIRAERERKGMTLEELATKIRSTKSYIWELENKPAIRPSAEKLFKLAAALEVTADYLADDEVKAPTPDIRDQAFFSKFQKLGAKDKETLRRFLDSLDDD